MKYLKFFIITLLFTSCNNINNSIENTKGKLFIIGGGKRPISLIKYMIQISEMGEDDYIYVLPMASSEPDSAAFYINKQFKEAGFKKFTYTNFQKGELISQERLDSLKNAKLIYITGGDQSRFMNVVKDSPLFEAIHFAYKNGSTIAGTSAGAAVQSKKMVTGNEFKHPEYTGEFRTIEADNIELKEGMGFEDNFIIDQHFVWRMRMNRLISVAIENPDNYCFGIDESTALIYDNGYIEIAGLSQVIYIKNNSEEKYIKDGLLGSMDMDLKVLLPGDRLKLK